MKDSERKKCSLEVVATDILPGHLELKVKGPRYPGYLAKLSIEDIEGLVRFLSTHVDRMKMKE